MTTRTLMIPAALIAVAACDGIQTQALRPSETWTGFSLPEPLLPTASAVAEDDAEDDTIWYQFVFEYAEEGPYEDDEFRATLLTWENLEEDDTDCDLEWLPEDDRTCRVVVTGDGWHSEVFLSEHIHVGGLVIPTLDSPCTFAGPVSLLGNWLADLRCGEDAVREVTVHFSTLWLDDDRR